MNTVFLSRFFFPTLEVGFKLAVISSIPPVKLCNIQRLFIINMIYIVKNFALLLGSANQYSSRFSPHINYKSRHLDAHMDVMYDVNINPKCQHSYLSPTFFRTMTSIQCIHSMWQRTNLYRIVSTGATTSQNVYEVIKNHIHRRIQIKRVIHETRRNNTYLIKMLTWHISLDERLGRKPH